MDRRWGYAELHEAWARSGVMLPIRVKGRRGRIWVAEAQTVAFKRALLGSSAQDERQMNGRS